MSINDTHHHALGHSYSSAYAGSCLGALAVLMEDVELAEKHGNEAMALSVERGYPFFIGIASYVLGWAKGMRGDLAGSVQLFEQGIAIWDAMGSLVWRTLPWTWKIQVHLQHGDIPGAQHSMEMAYRELERTGERFMLPVLKRLEGDIVLGLAKASTNGDGAQAGVDPTSRAEELYREALALSREREARTFELLALIALHDLLKDSARASEATEELKSVYATFEVGHDLPMLRRAQERIEPGGAAVRTATSRAVTAV